MKQTGSDKRTNKHKNQPQMSLDLSRALAVWYQSACTFQAMYNVLEKTLQSLQKIAINKPSSDSRLSGQSAPRGIYLLEEVQKAMLVELKQLLEAMEEGPEVRQEAPQEFIEQLQLHTFHLQKQTKRIQWALALSESGPN